MSKPICSECGAEYSVARAALGYTTCLACGDIQATLQTIAKAARVALTANKGAYQFITPGTDLTVIGKKH